MRMKQLKCWRFKNRGYGCKEYKKPLMHAYEMSIKALEDDSDAQDAEASDAE